MKMNFKKKHQKRLINFWILLLFLLVLNSNSTFTFKNYESKYINDNYEENLEDLKPELIVESPKNADYFSHLEFMPYGTYIYAPKYIQRYEGQSNLNKTYFILYDANEGRFSKFRVYVNDVLENEKEWPLGTVEFNINTYMQTSGTYNITAQALCEKSNEWITHHSILNVTSTSPCISPFYDDFMHSQNSSGSLHWDIDTINSRYFNYTININDTEYVSNTISYNNSIKFNYTSYEDFDILNSVYEIKLEIIAPII